MAWISVHEQVIGGKLRSLAKEIGCSQNEALGLLVRLWLWGINNADKEGRIIGAEKRDIAEILTIGIDSRYTPQKVVDAMVSTKWIDIDNGLYIHDWDEWQEQWYKALEVRMRDAKRKREERAKKRIEREKISNDTIPIALPNKQGKDDKCVLDEQKNISEDAEQGSELKNIDYGQKVISLILNDKSLHDVYQNDVNKWEELYPAVNIIQELKKMAGWLDNNPTRRKTKRGINRFINNWLSNAQDKGKNGNSFNQFSQQSYDMQELEDKLISN